MATLSALHNTVLSSRKCPMLLSSYASRLRSPVLRRPRRDTYLRGGGRGAWISPSRLLRTRRRRRGHRLPAGLLVHGPLARDRLVDGLPVRRHIGDRAEPGDAARDAAPPCTDRQAARR